MGLRAHLSGVLRASLLALAVAACASPEEHRSSLSATPAAAVRTVDGPASGPALAPPVARPLRVLVGGDLLPHRPSLAAPATIRAALEPLAPLFGKADAVVANYEAATGDVDPRASRLAYAAPPGWLEELPRSGLKAVTVANNHACDLGEAGLDATLASAAKSGLLALGADASEPWAPRTIVEQNGKRICAVAWTTLSNSDGGCAKGRRLAVAALNGSGKSKIDRALARARTQCDATVAIFHGGSEYAPQTSLVMDQAAHAAESGADAVVIHHPHIASPVVVHPTKDGRSVPIFASVGNLVTNQGESWKPPMFPVLAEDRHLVCVNGWTRLGVLADLSFTFDPKGARLDWGMHLLWIDNEHAQDHAIAMPKIAARLLDADKDRVIIAKLSEDRRGPLALFTDPCWLERESSTARCSTPAGVQAGGPPVPSHLPFEVAKKRAPRLRR